MPASQLNYSRRPARGNHGMVSDTFPHAIDTRSNTETDDIGFGVPVSEGDTADGNWTCKKFDGNGADANDFVGVAVKNIVQGLNKDLYSQYTNVDVLVSGDMYLTVVQDVEAGAAVRFADGTTPTTAKPNGWTSRAAETAAATQTTTIPGARFMTKTSAGGLATVRFDGSLV